MLTSDAAMLHVFVPALMYYSVLDGLYAAISRSSAKTVAEVIFPPLWCLAVLSIGFLVAFFTTMPFRRGKEIATQRTILVAAAIGNSGDMPLLILSTLCDNFEPFRTTQRCISRSAQVTSLFGAVWNMVIVRMLALFCSDS